MVRKEMQFVGLEKLADLDAFHDLIHARAESKFDNKLCEYERLLEENDEVDVDYKNFLLYILTKAERVESHKKRRERDDDVCDHDSDCFAKENDPQYELFLKSLTEHETSYVLEDEKNGLPVVIKYEGDAGSDKECDPEPRRKLRSAMKQRVGPSNQMPGVENQCKHDSQSTSTKETKNLTWRKSRNRGNSEKVENVKFSTNEMVPDSDYLNFIQTLKVVEDHYVYVYGDHTVAYELNDGENNQVKEEHEDECSSDLEILDSTSFYKEGNLNPSMVASFLKNMNKDSILNLGGPTMQSEFRHQVITVLRKSYDEEEYDKLWLVIERRKPEERHVELRHGRERSCFTNKDGKSYLDHYPDFTRQLLQFQDDKPKCLNLLRGFFFWLRNFMQNGSFRPWQDAECLAINPESC
ncbi:hypothetical protein Pfo_017213 [Paulownia fortunei]|nr:hypothetical protein Pfo_017213 [Paulownia fortunei]